MPAGGVGGEIPVLLAQIKQSLHHAQGSLKGDPLIVKAVPGPGSIIQTSPSPPSRAKRAPAGSCAVAGPSKAGGSGAVNRVIVPSVAAISQV